MTWIPIWTTANKILIYPLVIPSLSYGLYLYAFIAYGGRKNDITEDLNDEKEMKFWSLSLSDPKSPNYNPFIFKKN
jgi:hypothetical protein